MKNTLLTLLTSLSILNAAPTKEKLPPGFEPISKFAEVQQEAIAKKKLLLIVVKGSNDSCPNCANALEKGMKAASNGTQKIFLRAANFFELEKQSSNLPPAAQKTIAAMAATRQIMDGAAVALFVFDSNAEKILASMNRDSLENNKGAAYDEFKKAVQEARKNLKDSSSMSL